jgi:hypothetical protein
VPGVPPVSKSAESPQPRKVSSARIVKVRCS